MELLLMPFPIPSNFLLNVAPFFEQKIIYDYCLAIDEKEAKGLCSNDLKRDLLRIISIQMKKINSEDQIKAISFIEDCIKTYDEKLETS
jgi:hypothetical protein